MKINENPMRIDPVGLPDKGTTSSVKGEGSEGIGFKDQLKSMLYQVNEMGQVADQKVMEVVTGESDDLHNAMVALEEANVSFQLMLEVRNKMLEAYQEINRMNI
jgi:flagellar hook-basal body complex protein FliE